MNRFLGGPGDQCMVYDENDNRSDNGDKYAPQIDTSDTGRTKRRKDCTADQSADYSQDDVTNQAFATLVDYFAADKPRDQTNDEPCDDTHISLLLRSYFHTRSAGHCHLTRASKPPPSPWKHVG